MSEVSRNGRPVTQDRQRKLTGESKPVGLAVITYYGDTRAVCSCGGFSMSHLRSKVLEDGIDRHLSKKHDGRGIRL